MKHFLSFSIVAVTLLFTVPACNRKHPIPEPPIPEPSLSRLYILNSGNYGGNDANLAYYDIKAGEMVYDVFQKVNGKKLGDVAQDMIVFGSKMYISVGNSKVIFVTDYDGKIIDEIKVPMEEINLSPRYFTTYKDKLYVSFYEGYLGQIDTTTFAVKCVRVDSNPEQIVEANGRIFVACSGGMNYPNYGKTVSVVDPNSMTVHKTIEVVDNPMFLEVDSKDNVYLMSAGNYADVPAALQRISSVTFDVTVIEGISPTYMAMTSDDILYLVSGTFDENWNQTFTYTKFDTVVGKQIGDLISDGTTVPNAHYIHTDEQGNAYIGSSDYASTGDVYVYTPYGKSSLIIETGGVNPICTLLLNQ